MLSNFNVRQNPYKIIIVSPNSKFSPAQQDLLKLAETPDKFNAEVFDRITAFHGSEYFRKNGYATDMPYEDFFKSAEYENLDYDLILSAIQSMVK